MRLISQSFLCTKSFHKSCTRPFSPSPRTRQFGREGNRIAGLRMASPQKYTRKRKGEIEVVRRSSVRESAEVASADFSRFRHVRPLRSGNVERGGESVAFRGANQEKGEEEEEDGEGGACRVDGELFEVCGVSSVGKVEGYEDGGGSVAKVDTVVVDHVGVEGGCDTLLKVVDDLVLALTPLTFKSPVEFVYNPLEYARKPHEEYVRKYGGKKVDVLFVGMNPGPFGMAQTGIPFGDNVLVRDFLHITGEVETPKRMHPKRPILGFKCPRREVSGQRLWGWAQARFGTANAFLDRFWVHNYCPLMFMESSGKNRTPDKLTVSERGMVTSACNVALRSIIALIQPRFILGVGKYAGERIKECAPPGTVVGDIMHPSPANPKANKNWDKIIEAQLEALGVVV